MPKNATTCTFVNIVTMKNKNKKINAHYNITNTRLANELTMKTQKIHKLTQLRITPFPENRNSKKQKKCEPPSGHGPE